MNYPNKVNLCELLPQDYLELIDKEILLKTQTDLNEEIKRSKNELTLIYPNINNLFNVFWKCPIENIRVVIIGQDPYHNNINQANGIAFSVLNEIETLPPSLKNIFKELKNCYPNIDRKCGDLEDWVEQGVFLLNTALTVRKGEPESHINIWEKFTDYIIDIIQNKGNVIFCIWGKFAESKIHLIKNTSNIILKSSHPSPFSALKTDVPFIGSEVFLKIDYYLEKLGYSKINWV
jgi:uracil-DNA glycosylase